MNMKFLSFVFLTLLFSSSCSSGNESAAVSPPAVNTITLKLAADHLQVEGVGSRVELDITIENGDQCAYIAVRKMKEGAVLYRLPDLTDISSGECFFSYVIEEEDLKGGELAFQFIPVDINNIFGTEYLLTVDILEQKNVLKVVKAAKIARVTGNSVAGEQLPNPNNTSEAYNIGGTDLGIYWRLGGDRVGVLFGDTYGRDWRPGYTPDWRSNVLAFSTDTNLEDGLTFDSMLCDNDGNAKQVIFSAHDTSGQGDWSSIPTAAIRLNGVDYIHYMNVKAWNPSWLTNWSGYAVSKDDCQTWELHTNIFSSTSKFAQQALWEKDGYVYSIGSIIGRRGLPYLARFQSADILNPSKYEYWNSENGWCLGDETEASPLFGNYVDEMYAEPTLVYHDYFQKWITVYYNEIKDQIVLRSADDLTGEWSEESIIVRGADYPEPYGGFIYPLNLTEPYIYISLSQWDPLYNVFLMKVDLEMNKE